jgi:hypothetical protein
MRDMRNEYNFWLENFNGREHSAALCEDERIILKFILGK